MNGRFGARLLLTGCCLLLLKLTGCPGPQPRSDPQPVTPASTPTGPNGTNPSSSPPPEPIPPESIPARNQCPLEAAGRTCNLTVTDDGSAAPAPHPCQYPEVGVCDPAGQPLCRFRWKGDGERCNNNLGVCQGRRCRCDDERRCGYDCSAVCDAGAVCRQGQCVAGLGPGPAPRPCGGCAHRDC